jgi:Tol biopolymer transport system component
MSRFVVVVFALASVPAVAQTTTLVSHNPHGQVGLEGSLRPSISADGRFIAFYSLAHDLVPGDTNNQADVFLYDRVADQNTRVSVDSSGAQGNGGSRLRGDAISADGRFVAFQSDAPNLVAGDTNAALDVFVHDRQSGRTTRVSVDSGGVQGDGDSWGGSISADGRFVAFWSYATNLVPGDSNGRADVFVRDLHSGQTTLVSVGAFGTPGDGDSQYPCISADGRIVAFHSRATTLVPGDTNHADDVFVHDRVTGTTTRVSIGPTGAEADGGSDFAALSADGRFIAFESGATNLVANDTNGTLDVFVRDLVTRETQRVSVGRGGVQANDSSGAASLSRDGRIVAFYSNATNLFPNDANASTDVFVHDRLTASTTLVSIDSNGVQADNWSVEPVLSADGRYVAFWSQADNLVPANIYDFNLASDVFLRDRGDASSFVSFCAGDGSGGACPCANRGATGHGCENSAATGGAMLAASGIASLAADTVQLTCSDELASAPSIVMQGSTTVSSVLFGDGLRCAGGNLERLYNRNAVGGVVAVPQPGDPSISARSSASGDPLSLGATRIYQVFYRDPNASFCPNPPGSTFNISNAIAIAWAP